jgi:hypothetical protein
VIIIHEGETEHLKSVLDRGNALLLVGRIRSGNEYNSVETFGFLDGLSDYKVTNVRRIKCTPEKTELHDF